MAEQDKAGWIAIKYVGSKPNGDVDHNYGSGVVWTGKDDVQLVPPEAAVKLLKHPEYKDARNNFARKPIVVPEKVEKEVEEEAPLISLEASTKAQIALYAKRNFGIELDTSAKKEEMVDRVRSLMNKAPR